MHIQNLRGDIFGSRIEALRAAKSIIDDWQSRHDGS